MPKMMARVRPFHTWSGLSPSCRACQEAYSAPSRTPLTIKTPYQWMPNSGVMWIRIGSSGGFIDSSSTRCPSDYTTADAYLPASAVKGVKKRIWTGCCFAARFLTPSGCSYTQKPGCSPHDWARTVVPRPRRALAGGKPGFAPPLFDTLRRIRSCPVGPQGAAARQRIAARQELSPLGLFVNARHPPQGPASE